MTDKLIQALHAGISRRDWHATEVAANGLRDALSLGHPIQGEVVAAENVQALVELWRDMDKSHKVPDKFLERLSEVIDCINSSQPSPAEVTDTSIAKVRILDLERALESAVAILRGEVGSGWAERNQYDWEIIDAALNSLPTPTKPEVRGPCIPVTYCGLATSTHIPVGSDEDHCDLCGHPAQPYAVKALIGDSGPHEAMEITVKPLDDDAIMEVIRECFPWRDEGKILDLLVREKSAPMFPQATWNVPNYRAEKFVRAIEARFGVCNDCVPATGGEKE